MAINTIQRVAVTNAGITQNPVSAVQPDITYLSIAANLVLAGNVSFNNSDFPPNGTSYIYLLDGGNGSVDLNGFTFQINGVNLGEDQLKAPLLFYNTSLGTDWDTPIITQSFDASAIRKSLNGAFLTDASIALAKLVALTRGALLVGDASARPSIFAKGADTYFLQSNATDLIWNVASGAVTVSNTGVFSIVAGYITNAMVNAAADIGWAKMAALTASQVVVTSAGGVITTASSLSAALGGFGASMAAATGFTSWAAGVASTGALTETLRCDVSFLTAGQGTYYVRVPFPCTVTAAKARVTSALSATDDGSVTLKNNTGTSMTSGLITIPLSSAHGTGVTCTPSANNTFAANEEIQLLVAKTTSGGLASVDITITRLTLS